MDVSQVVTTISIYTIPVLFAITLHEAAHGYVARHFGDLTAYAEGRISLNPVRHIDLVGTIVVPLAILLLSAGQFLFGWAKPVPVNFAALRRPKRDMIWVAAAGPGSNLAMALAWAAMLRFTPSLPDFFAVPLSLMCEAGIRVNLVLMFLNLIPILPLDGGRITVGLLPMALARRYAKLERWGLFILIALLVTHVLDAVLGPLVYMSESLLR